MQKHADKETVTIARIQAQAVASKVSTYSLKADSYVWNRETGRFEDADSVVADPIFISEKTGNELSLKELVPDEGSLLGIQQVIQQSFWIKPKNRLKSLMRFWGWTELPMTRNLLMILKNNAPVAAKSNRRIRDHFGLQRDCAVY